ncbi:MAG: ABC transporter ATP-binding protein [Bryobacterales bacterium]|nr:ABC transporter ATP-binding protein [Bryobacterales bacterium]
MQNPSTANGIAPAESVAAGPPAIETKGIGKLYRLGWKQRTLQAVENVDLRVAAGATFGLLGPNGAGKTTLVKMLLGMTKPSGGGAWIYGVDCRDRRARTRVGYLPENGRYPAYHTGRSLLEFHGKLGGLEGAGLGHRVDEVLGMVSMRQWARLRLAKYSKGMLQRIGIAQALLHRPSLLMLDEPTDGVDPVGRSQIRELLVDLNAKGVTVFLNSHILAEVEQYCDDVAILHKGRLLLSGSVEELTHRSGYSLLCESPKGELPQGLDHLVSDRPQALHKYADGRVKWHVDVANLDLLNAAIDLLRRHRSQIETIEKNQNTLEEVFLEAVRGSTHE